MDEIDLLDQLADRPFGRGSDAESGWEGRYPPDVRAAIRMGGGAWPLAVQRAVDRGLMDLDKLTDLAFWMHVPELGGERIPLHHPSSAEWVALWTWLRKGASGILSAAPSPGRTRPAGGGGGSSLTPFSNIRRVWVHTNTKTIVGSGSTQTRRRKELCSLAPTDIVIGVNDVSAAYTAHRGNGGFTTYSSAKPSAALDSAVSELKSCGAAIHFMTWITPRKRYCEGLVGRMFALCRRAGARSLLLDAEEPWMRKAEGGSHAAFVRDVFTPLLAGRPCCVGACFIVYGSKTKLDPLIGACAYTLPQAYTPSTGKPGRLQRVSMARWARTGKAMVMGLSGMSRITASRMRADLAETDKLGSVREVYYWSFANLRASSSRLAVARQAVARARSTSPASPVPALCHL